MKRWNILAGGVLILLAAGIIYAWSVLEMPIAAEYPNWTRQQISLTFTMVMIFFCLGGMVNGIFSSRLKPKHSIWIGIAFLAAGLVISSKVSDPSALLFTFGMTCGFGSGMAYNAVLGSVNGWFPDKRGLASGISLMAFGLSSFIIGKLYQAFTPVEIGGWRTSFRAMAGIAAVMMFLGSLVLQRPEAKEKGSAESNENDKTPAEMLRSSVFWMYFIWAIVLSAAGLVAVSQASGIAGQTDPTIPAASIATAAGMISIFNGIGRVIVGGLYDKIGRRGTMMIPTIGFLITAALLMTALKSGSFTILLAAFICAGLSYGGVTPVHPTFTSSYFGTKHYATNYSIVNLNLIVASFGSMISGTLFDKTGSYYASFAFIIGLAAVGIVMLVGIGAYDRRNAIRK